MEEEYEIKSTRLNSFKGFLRTFFWLSREEWTNLDHKMIRIVFGAVGFVAVVLFWLFFLRSITPF